LHEVDLFAGLNPDGDVLINTKKSVDELGLSDLATGVRAKRLLTVPATELAQRCIGRPVPNTVLLGGLAALTGVVPPDAVVAAIRRRFRGPLADANAAAASEAAAYVRTEQEAITRA
jgi:pyruvate ferredoxin oxidoreductase gamma subunit